ncbi:recombinase RecA [Candidatus Jorgensenbacteria bacterium RIFCSPLOWO2_01_FULL_45_25b]|uniref:Protein RecA n=1 Tax=Candidatus Jorgensenbacteria bacterium RIFCSPLOWO2_01_FULL_45_25b TaxID=1798471 RepID=A0A1F6BWE8_9BACT|nr:MAG: recombinase RecA [Candidatus Jorgensenbacteria bacterium RIFCSPLOWO2_01_FULL_45_25b]
MPKKTKETKSEEKESLSTLMENLQSRFGEGAVMLLGDKHHIKIEAISTGSFSLDIALGVGGFPKGRVVEIYGPESSGKTTLALHAVAEVQRKGGKAAFIDAEHALDPEYAARIGVKIKDLIISQPDNGEEALNILEAIVRSEMIDVVVVDSVAALTPRAEIEGEMGASHMGLQARLMSQALRKITAIADKAKTIIIFINQTRMKIGIVFGNPETTPGGMALKFYASVRVDIRRIAQIKKGEEIVGNRTRAKVVKNKVAPPFKVAEFDIMYGEGISYEADVLTTGMKYGVIQKAGATLSFEGEKIAVGFDASRLKLKEDKKLLEAIKKKTLASIVKTETEEEKKEQKKEV